MNPESLKFTKDHEWIGEDGGVYAVGISNHAQDQLGDITYVELPDTDRVVKQKDEIATVESVKAASDIYAPVDGTVVAVNEDLDTQPELVNQDPFGKGWFFKLDNINKAQFDALMDYAAYQKFAAENAE
jgi:glycine cleavage system H protein